MPTTRAPRAARTGRQTSSVPRHGTASTSSNPTAVQPRSCIAATLPRAPAAEPPPRSVGWPPMKVVSIVGNRPQFIKAAPVAAALEGLCEHVLVHTGQHYDDDLS